MKGIFCIFFAIEVTLVVKVVIIGGAEIVAPPGLTELAAQHIIGSLFLTPQYFGRISSFSRASIPDGHELISLQIPLALEEGSEQESPANKTFLLQLFNKAKA